jgi:hypothetical protein
MFVLMVDPVILEDTCLYSWLTHPVILEDTCLYSVNHEYKHVSSNIAGSTMSTNMCLPILLGGSTMSTNMCPPILLGQPWVQTCVFADPVILEDTCLYSWLTNPVILEDTCLYKHVSSNITGSTMSTNMCLQILLGGSSWVQTYILQYYWVNHEYKHVSFNITRWVNYEYKHVSSNITGSTMSTNMC